MVCSLRLMRWHDKSVVSKNTLADPRLSCITITKTKTVQVCDQILFFIVPSDDDILTRHGGEMACTYWYSNVEWFQVGPMQPVSAWKPVVGIKLPQMSRAPSFIFGCWLYWWCLQMSLPHSPQEKKEETTKKCHHHQQIKKKSNFFSKLPLDRVDRGFRFQPHPNDKLQIGAWTTAFWGWNWRW